MPKVSISIPTYQHANFLGEAIDSVLAQTYRDFELIVIDDGSTDNTADIVGKYGDKVKYIYQDNKGLAGARNTGIKASQGEYIAFLDADDVWLPNKLDLEVNFLDRNPAVGLVYSNYTYFGNRAIKRTTGFAERYPVSGKPIKELFMLNPIISSAILIRKECFDKTGLFDESLRQCEDLDMWLRITQNYTINYIEVPLAKYRLHEDNMHWDKAEHIPALIDMRKKCLQMNKGSLRKEDLKEMEDLFYLSCRSIGYRYLINGSPKVAKKILWQYLWKHPYDLVADTWFIMSFLPINLSSWFNKFAIKFVRSLRIINK